MKKIIKGKEKPVIGIVSCLHGNETLGKEVIELLLNINLTYHIVYIIANEEAIIKNKRYIDMDLNRCFPGNINGNHEEKLAAEILKELSECDYVIDIHSTTAETEEMIIITRSHEITDYINVNKIVLMEPDIAKGKSLIDNVKCGFSLEFNHKTKPEKVRDIIINFINSISLDKKIKFKHEFYSCYEILKEDEINDDFKLENFILAKVNGEEFYPIMYGETDYKGIICLKAKLLKV